MSCRFEIKAPKIIPGNTIGIFGISNHVEEKEISEGISILEGWGLRVRLASNLFRRHGRYDGTVPERISATQELLDDPEVSALIATRGGYGASQVTPYLDYSPLLRNPKWIVGYSDVTSLHLALARHGLQSLHGPMLRNMGDSATLGSLHDALFGEAKGLGIPYGIGCRKGEATGTLVGGNLSLIYSLQGTDLQIDTRDAILFIEDEGESAYSIDRMLQNLLLSGKIRSIKGLIVGQFSDFTNEGGMDGTLFQVIADKLRGLDIPVMFGVDAGHEWNNHKAAPNYTLRLGAKIHMKVDDRIATFSYLD